MASALCALDRQPCVGHETAALFETSNNGLPPAESVGRYRTAVDTRERQGQKVTVG